MNSGSTENSKQLQRWHEGDEEGLQALLERHLPWLRELEPQSVYINSVDAEARGIKNGDMVRVFNDRGVTIVPARVTERIMPRVVDLPPGAWYDPDENGIDRGGCANILTRDEHSPGGAYTTNTSLVQVEKA